jgi:hypothetical protein
VLRRPEYRGTGGRLPARSGNRAWRSAGGQFSRARSRTCARPGQPGDCHSVDRAGNRGSVMQALAVAGVPCRAPHMAGRERAARPTRRPELSAANRQPPSDYVTPARLNDPCPRWRTRIDVGLDQVSRLCGASHALRGRFAIRYPWVGLGETRPYGAWPGAIGGWLHNHCPSAQCLHEPSHRVTSYRCCRASAANLTPEQRL